MTKLGRIRATPYVWIVGLAACAATREPLLSPDDVAFVEKLAHDVIEASRVRVGESAGGQGPNSTGCTLIRPGGRDDYPAFWIRDYAMSLECGAIAPAEQLPLVLLTASTEPLDAAPRELASGSRLPRGSIPDHITFRGRPIFFPGTIDDEAHQGGATWGITPPLDDAFFFVHMVHEYVAATGDAEVLARTIDGASLLERVRAALAMPPRRADGLIVHVDSENRGVNFGFDDSIVHTGDLLFASLLEYRASLEFADLEERASADSGATRAEAASLRRRAADLRAAIRETFALRDGLLCASTGASSQPDVWGTAFGVWIGAFDAELERRACDALAREYSAGHIAWRGAIRHVPTDRDARADSAWDTSLAAKNRYQNGAYWSTPTGWVAYAIAKSDRKLAARLLGELVADLRAGDFRKGANFGAPFECAHPDGDYRQNPIYMTSVTCPLATIRRLERER